MAQLQIWDGRTIKFNNFNKSLNSVYFIFSLVILLTLSSCSKPNPAGSGKIREDEKVEREDNLLNFKITKVEGTVYFPKETALAQVSAKDAESAIRIYFEKVNMQMAGLEVDQNTKRDDYIELYHPRVGGLSERILRYKVETQ